MIYFQIDFYSSVIGKQEKEKEKNESAAVVKRH
jgi:hypothetical protein